MKLTVAEAPGPSAAGSVQRTVCGGPAAKTAQFVPEVKVNAVAIGVAGSTESTSTLLTDELNERFWTVMSYWIALCFVT
jgi:hypothetical protein